MPTVVGIKVVGLLVGVKVVGLLVGEVVGGTVFTGAAVEGLKDGEVVEGLTVGLAEGDFVGEAEEGEKDICDPLDSPRNSCLKAVKLTCIYKPSFHLQLSQ